MYSCCNDALIIDGIQMNRCIAPEMIRELVPDLNPLPPFKPTRKDCGCIASVDIGVYDTCLFGCTYCYATNHRQAARHRYSAHDPSDSILWSPGHLTGKDFDAEVQSLME